MTPGTFTRSFKDYYATIITILVVILGRAAFLQYLDLIDPTEARYANVAENMLLSNDWITPKLHMPEGVVPYMGKPPLHYWLTAIAYSIFGISEWSSRLPSLLGALVIIGALFSTTRKYRGLHEAAAASMVLLTSGLFFFVAGASVTDVTMTALITLSILCAYRFLIDKESPQWPVLLAAFFGGLAFLCKGPFTSVLIALPILLWAAAGKEFQWIRRIPWPGCILLFILTVIPWFAWSEFRLPGFLRYFLWNENISRYLVKDYGDKYGVGHTHAYGTSWIMVTVSFLPWSPLLLWSVLANGWRATGRLIKSDPYLLLGFCWAISAPLFLTFMKNFHAMYLLPALPGLAMITGALMLNGVNSF